MKIILGKTRKTFMKGLYFIHTISCSVQIEKNNQYDSSDSSLPLMNSVFSYIYIIYFRWQPFSPPDQSSSSTAAALWFWVFLLKQWRWVQHPPPPLEQLTLTSPYSAPLPLFSAVGSLELILLLWCHDVKKKSLFSDNGSFYLVELI